MNKEELRLSYRGKQVLVRLDKSASLSLWIEGCLRKERPVKAKVYLWTNVELDWEEHHYLEVYYQRETGRIKITANSETLLESSFA